MAVAIKSPAIEYIEGVLSGSIVVGRLARLAVERHVSDLREGHKRGLYFNEAAAQRVIDFFGFLTHSKGEWAGQPFNLSPWQAFMVWVLFGWKRSDGMRRFRIAYNEVARKNGKSTFAAGVGLYLFLADQEAGAEVYSAATKRDQAKIIHSEATRMVQASPYLRKVITVVRDNLSIRSTNSKYEPLGADADTLDGLNIHGAIIDEIHAHRTRAVIDVLETATSARRQPLQFEVTTAGYDQHSICFEHHDYSVKVLEGVVEDDTWFAFIAALDEGDDWTDEHVWAKANPNLGISVKLDDLQRKCEKAQQVPAAQNNFRRLHLDEWTRQSTRWLDLSKWDATAGEANPEELKGRICYGGLDLASTTDIAALALVFPYDNDFKVLMRFWIPSEAMRERSQRGRVPYDVWVRQGLIKATEGNVIDYRIIRQDIEALAEQYNIREIGFDRWGATQLIQELQDADLTVVQIGQGFASMSAPTKELLNLVLGKRLHHGGNPVLRWMADNMVVKQDPAGNLKPDKEKSTEKIDGMVALVMAIDRASRNDTGVSVYEEEDRGLLIL